MAFGEHYIQITAPPIYFQGKHAPNKSLESSWSEQTFGSRRKHAGQENEGAKGLENQQGEGWAAG